MDIIVDLAGQQALTQ